MFENPKVEFSYLCVLERRKKKLDTQHFPLLSLHTSFFPFATISRRPRINRKLFLRLLSVLCVHGAGFFFSFRCYVLRNNIYCHWCLSIPPLFDCRDKQIVMLDTRFLQHHLYFGFSILVIKLVYDRNCVKYIQGAVSVEKITICSKKKEKSSSSNNNNQKYVVEWKFKHLWCAIRTRLKMEYPSIGDRSEIL